MRKSQNHKFVEETADMLLRKYVGKPMTPMLIETMKAEVVVALAGKIPERIISVVPAEIDANAGRMSFTVTIEPDINEEGETEIFTTDKLPLP